MPDLDERLATSRTDLLGGIRQPPLAEIRHRAARRRQRRAAALTAAAVLTVVAATVVAVRPDVAPAPPPADRTETGPVYAADGITIAGLPATGAQQVPGRPGSIEFGDAEHGYLLTACVTAEPCRSTLYATADGGRTWQERQPLPAQFAADALVAFPGGRLVIEGATGALVSADEGRTWRSVPLPGELPARPALGRGERLRLGYTPDGCGGRLEVRTAADGPRGRLAGQPDLRVCWVAPVAASDGAWWVGGHRDGLAAVAVSRDAGRTWTTTPLDVAGGDRAWPTVAALGRHVHLAVTGEEGRLDAVYHSADGGRTFTATRRPGATGLPSAVAGELVPLLDGRLLAVGGDHRWYVSGDRGATFRRADGTLPAVGQATRTPAGYVVRDLFNAGWAAFSPDGAHWRKLPIS